MDLNQYTKAIEAGRGEMMDDWKLWKIKHTDHIAKALPRRIREMRAVHGELNGRFCGDCVHFIQLGSYARNYYKCEKSKLTHGDGTDWRMKWPACGKFSDRKLREKEE